MKVHLYITLKDSILDHKAEMFEKMINDKLSLSSPIAKLRVGKYITFEIEKETKPKIEHIIKTICDELLVDSISEIYEYKVDED